MSYSVDALYLTQPSWNSPHKYKVLPSHSTFKPRVRICPYANEVPEKRFIKPTKLPMTNGKLEVTIKINELPTNVQTNKDNWKIFQLDCDGRVVSVTVKRSLLILEIFQLSV
jgi:hypothetical protein